MKAAVGALIVVAHAAGFAVLAPRCRGHELVVSLDAPPASPTLALDGHVPEALASRVEIDDTPPGPGLHHRTWRVRYRGGVERSVGAAQLVGPFQDAPRCTGRVIVGQRLLDGGPGTIAAAMQAELTAELRGLSIFPVGDFVKIDALRLRWARIEAHPADRALVGEAAHGYVRASAIVVFERVRVPLAVALVPEVKAGKLTFRIAAHADLAFDSGAMQWLSDKLGADRIATRLARRQIDDALVTALAPPPPFQLSGGQTLRFDYCDEPVEVADGGYGALPFSVAIGRARDPRILPPRLGHGPTPAISRSTSVALDLDLDALNALLFELWRGGFLDRRLADAGLDRKFNEDPTVASLLSLRLAPPTLRLPPVLSVEGGALRLAAEAAIAIHDGATTTPGRVWGGLGFRFAPRSVAPVTVDLEELALTCEPSPHALAACYSELVSAIRGRGAELHGSLTRTFTSLLSDIFVGRLGAAGLPAELVVRGVTPSVAASTRNATVHLELDATVAAPH